MTKINYERIVTDEQYREGLRWRAQTDLLWLAKEVLGYSLVNEKDHRELADHFIKKDPRKPIEKQDTKFKTRLIIIPRRTYKTTFNICDTVQWIIGFPEVAIMVMTASNSEDSPLADAFVDEVGSHFSHEEGKEPTLLEHLFPEHALGTKPKAGFKGRFTTPARQRYRRDPTLRGVSIEQSLSGWHPDIIKSEDVQDNRNSQTAYALKKVRTNFYINLKMLADWSYTDITGTRYGPADLYGHMIQTAGPRTDVMWKPAYIRKQHALNMEEWELTEKDVDLQFPHQLPWDFLMEKKGEDEGSFWTQYMNIAEGNFKSTFPIERLRAAKIHEDDIPLHGSVHIAWRFEYANSKNAACCVGIQSNGRMTIVDILRGPMTPTALSKRVVSVARKWECHRVRIEATPGAQTMDSHILNEALEQFWQLNIEWTEFLQDDTARALAIKAAEPHLLAGRLLFSEGIPNVEEKFRLLYHYGMIEDDDVPSVVSKVAACLPASVAADEFEQSDPDAWQEFAQRDAYDRMFGRGIYEEVEVVLSTEDDDYYPQTDSMGLSEAMPGLSG